MKGVSACIFLRGIHISFTEMPQQFEQGKINFLFLISHPDILIDVMRKHPAPTEETSQDGGLEGGSSKHIRFDHSPRPSSPTQENENSDKDATQGMLTLLTLSHSN